MVPSRIQTATFRIVVQWFNELRSSLSEYITDLESVTCKKALTTKSFLRRKTNELHDPSQNVKKKFKKFTNFERIYFINGSGEKTCLIAATFYA